MTLNRIFIKLHFSLLNMNLSKNNISIKFIKEEEQRCLEFMKISHFSSNTFVYRFRINFHNKNIVQYQTKTIQFFDWKKLVIDFWPEINGFWLSFFCFFRAGSTWTEDVERFLVLVAAFSWSLSLGNEKATEFSFDKEFVSISARAFRVWLDVVDDCEEIFSLKSFDSDEFSSIVDKSRQRWDFLNRKRRRRKHLVEINNRFDVYRRR